MENADADIGISHTESDTCPESAAEAQHSLIEMPAVITTSVGGKGKLSAKRMEELQGIFASFDKVRNIC